MSREELDILRMWANEILACDRARLMTIEEMNGTISLLHKGGDTDDSPRDCKPEPNNPPHSAASPLS